MVRTSFHGIASGQTVCLFLSVLSVWCASCAFSTYETTQRFVTPEIYTSSVRTPYNSVQDPQDCSEKTIPGNDFKQVDANRIDENFIENLPRSITNDTHQIPILSADLRKTYTVSDNLTNVGVEECGDIHVGVLSDSLGENTHTISNRTDSNSTVDILQNEQPLFGYLSLTTEDIADCFKQGSYLRFIAYEGTISFRNAGNYNSRIARDAWCRVKVTVPDTMKVVTYFGQTDRTCGLTVKVRDAQPRNYRHLATVCGDTPQKNVYSLTNVVLYLLKVKSFEEPFFFSLNFTSVPLKETSDQLEVLYTSLISGYVQTPGWDGVRTYPLNMKSSVRVDVPHGKTAMITFLNVDIDNRLLENQIGFYQVRCKDYEKVQLSFQRAGRSPDSEMSLCRQSRPEPALYNTEWFKVTFYSDSIDDGSTGFRMLFTFHNASALPEWVRGRWNCSVGYWADFKQHFPCDLSSDCAGGEDEVDCPYTTPRCGHGLIHAGGACFRYFGGWSRTSWATASVTCLQHGGRLPTLNTEQKQRDFLWLIRWARTDPIAERHTFIGMRAMGPFLPHV
ncbi:hypothetical protein BaRGS_00039651 [Batillaria attramentaria]|uniref:Uncharacterized protein n=1 Tax=Batillaria attramentaria TaxID=370345 RepID=A0ABD0J294_9CAEN